MAQAKSNLWPQGSDIGLIAAINDYLNRLQTSSDLNEDQIESLQVAVQCLQSLSPDGEFPQPAFALEDMYRGFAQSQNPPATSAPSQDEKVSERAATDSKAPPRVPSFDQFISMLKDRNFFQGCDPESEEYRKRLEAARNKYNTKFPENAVAREATEEEKEQATALKNEGNEFLKKREFAKALEKYSAAIELDSSNAVFWSNRAATYTHLKDYDAAAKDAAKSVELNPQYVKAYLRLALAEKERGNVEEALKAYEAAADLTPPTANNFTTIMDNIQKCRQEIERKSSSSSNNPLSGMPGGLPGGMPGGMPGGRGGMPDPSALNDMLGSLGGMGGLDGIMKNPMFAQMAQNLMQNPEMMNQMMGMMQDPQMADMARGFMNGGGGGPPSGAAPGGGGNSARQAALMRLLQDPDKLRATLGKVSADPEMQAMKADPSVAPLLTRLENGDMSVLMEFTSKPDVLRRLQTLLGKYVDES